MTAHRGPYRWSDDNHRMIVCEKWIDQLGAWVPFAALMDGKDDDANDNALAEDIWNRIEAGNIVPLPPIVQDIGAERDGMIIDPLQFRKGMRDFVLPRPLPAMFAGATTLRDVYDQLMNDPEFPGDVKDELEYAPRIRRTNATVEFIRSLIEWTEADCDNFFRHCMGK